MSVMRPFRELDLDHELRLDPDDVCLADLRHLRDNPERRLPALERPQLPQQPLDLPLVEAGAAVADVREVAPAANGEDERAERARAAPLPLRVAGDDELLPPVRLDLEPLARAPPRRVARVGAFGDDPLEALLLGRLVQRLAV